MSAIKSILFVQHRAPYGSEQPGELLDALLVAAAFGQKVSVLFQDDGVWQLLAQQEGQALQRKTLLSQLKALGLYEVEHLYVDAQSLAERGITAAQLGLELAAVDEAGLRALFTHHDVIIRA